MKFANYYCASFWQYLSAVPCMGQELLENIISYSQEKSSFNNVCGIICFKHLKLLALKDVCYYINPAKISLNLKIAGLMCM